VVSAWFYQGGERLWAAE